ncbi:hypothetical protein GCM10027341_09370 [Spirosoma knui]
MEAVIETPQTQKSNRRHDLDWLRVIAFGLLILFHAGLFFSHWDWFIKNNVVSYSINYPLMFLIQWRMPLLFMISGAGVYWSLGKRSAETFVGDRTSRLLLPLVFGVLVLVPPQIYVERLTEGNTYSYAQFYQQMLTFDLYPEGNFGWHHLWYLGYIFAYSLIGLPIWLQLRKPSGRRLTAQWAHFFNNPFWLIGIPVGWFLLGEMLNLPENERGFVNDWKTHFRYFSFFVFGYILCSQPLYWGTLSRYRRLLLGGAAVSLAVLLVFYWANWHELTGAEVVVYAAIRVTNYWCWLLTFFGYAYQYLNFTNRFLRYANQAVYPFYILHQTILLVVGYYLAPLAWPWQVKFMVMVTLTFGGCWAIYHFLIRPFRFVRPFFGVK